MKKPFQGMPLFNNPPAPVYGQPPPEPVKLNCMYCGRPMVPTQMSRWMDGTPMAPDSYTCGAVCPGMKNKSAKNVNQTNGDTPEKPDITTTPHEK